MLLYGFVRLWYLWPGSRALLHLALAKYAIQPYLHTHSSKITRYRYKFPTIIAASCLQYRSTIGFPNTFQCLVPHTPSPILACDFNHTTHF